MYTDYWGLKEKPFENTPNPRFLYPSQEHREALRKLFYAIGSEKGCALLTGEYGCGKTHLVRTVMSNLVPDKYEVALINYPLLGRDEFLQEIFREFGHESKSNDRAQSFRELSRFFSKNMALNKKNVLIIDEAQIIEDPEVYEELRLLLNLQAEDRFMLNILLVGQPELREQISKYPQLNQRIPIRFHLERFGQQDTVNYIRHRLKVAGADKEMFSEVALYLIYRISEGVPRLINSLCDLSLLEGATREVDVIGDEILKQVV